MRWNRIATLGWALSAGIAASLLWGGEAGEYFAHQIFSQDIYADRGLAGMARCLAQLHTRASLLMVTAHPDDEDGGMLVSQSRGLGARCTLMTLNRGEGGQNAMSPDLYDALGLVRTQELLQADRYYGVEQFWGRQVDYGFSKTREEALEKWGFDNTLADVVQVIRTVRPLVVTSVFVGAPTDGHGNHQVAGQMAQEAFRAAGDPHRFPEQLRLGLRPWSPVKVYGRVPFFAPTKDKTVYDYATDKYVPLRFYDYVARRWSEEAPQASVTVAEGVRNDALGLTSLQVGREGWGFQKSQNGGGTLPPPNLITSPYHRYGSRVEVPAKEQSFYDGVDVTLEGIATLVSNPPGFLTEGLRKLDGMVTTLEGQMRAGRLDEMARPLASGLMITRGLRRELRSSAVSEPGKSDVDFELGEKEKQFERALVLALGVSLGADVAPEKPPTGPFAAFAGPAATPGNVVPGQTFAVQTTLVNASAQALRLESLVLTATDGKAWQMKPTEAVPPTLEGGKDRKLRFEVKTPGDAALTRAYFTRPNEEQPYYDVADARYRNQSLAPYPLTARAGLLLGDVEFTVEKVVQANARVEGIGLLPSPLEVAPAISVSIAPAAGALPLDAQQFTLSCSLRSNINKARGKLKLELPSGWQAEPQSAEFSIARMGETDTVPFTIHPSKIKTGAYTLKAVAEVEGKEYREGYRMVGYPGLPPYPYFRPADYRVTAVDVKVAEGIKAGFIAGTGDDLPRALEDLKVPVRTLSAADVEEGDFSGLNVIVLGVRAYQAHPELRANNHRLLDFVREGGVLIVQYHTQNLDENYTPFPLSLGSNPEKVVDEFSKVSLLDGQQQALRWPNRLTPGDFAEWQEERGHGFASKWDSHFVALLETHDPGQEPQRGGLLLARYGKGVYVYDALALYRQLPNGNGGAYRILANLVSLAKPAPGLAPAPAPAQ